MPVNTKNQEYLDNLPLWTIVRDCIKGEHAIKKIPAVYLPKLPGHSDKDYEAYLNRTHFYMATARSADIFYGHIFTSQPKQSGDTPELFAQFLKNVNNEGKNIDQFASDLVWDIIQTGWGGILADHAPVPQGISQGDKERMGLTAFMKYYVAESIINWRYDTINHRQTLSLVVLEENYAEIDDDEFNPIQKKRYRVLRLRNNGALIYTQQEYLAVKNKGKNVTEYIPGEEIIPMLEGKPLDFIPFFTCPGTSPENSPLLGIAYENIGHYQKSADKENALHFSGNPTAYVAGMEAPRDKKTGDPIPMKLGGADFVFFYNDDKNSSGVPIIPHIGYLEISGSGVQLLLQEIGATESRMVKMAGQSISQEPKGVEAAATARIHRAGENAVIGSFSLNIIEQIVPAVRLAARWCGVPETITEQWSMSFNVEYSSDLSPEEKSRFAMNEVGDGLMSKRRYLTDVSGLSESEADEELQRIQKEEGGNLTTLEDE